MNPNDLLFESKVQSTARALPYPPTPDFAARLATVQPRPRRFAFPARLTHIAAALLIGFVMLFALVPEIRAGVLEFLRVGVISIFVQQAPTGTAIPSTALVSSLNLPNETTLDSARQGFNAPLLLPTYPADLGAPSHVYTFDYLVVLEWLDEAGQNRLTLFLFLHEMRGEKIVPFNPVEVDVNGERAVWLTDAHDVEIFTEGEENSLNGRVSGNVLIWTLGDVTYRMDTELPMDEAIRIAESMR